MNVCVRERSYLDKNTKEKKSYKELYISFEFIINGEYDTIDIPLKVEDTFARAMIIDNIESADFSVRKYVKGDNTYHFPVVNFNAGGKDYKVDVKLSPEAIVLARIGLDGAE